MSRGSDSEPGEHAAANARYPPRRASPDIEDAALKREAATEDTRRCSKAKGISGVSGHYDSRQPRATPHESMQPVRCSPGIRRARITDRATIHGRTARGQRRTSTNALIAREMRPSLHEERISRGCRPTDYFRVTRAMDRLLQQRRHAARVDRRGSATVPRTGSAEWCRRLMPRSGGTRRFIAAVACPVASNDMRQHAPNAPI